MRLMRIAIIPGSLRAGSYNRKLAGIAEEILKKHDVETDLIDLNDHPLPVYDGDVETADGIPDACWKLKAKIAATHAVIICSPEYNGGVPGMLKNTLDWTTRGGSNPWSGKVVMLSGASDGPWGTNRMQPSLRSSFAVMGALVIPQTITIPRANTVWDDSGMLLDETLPGRVEKAIAGLMDVTRKMTAERL
jgi:chromate reductase